MSVNGTGTGKVGAVAGVDDEDDPSSTSSPSSSSSSESGGGSESVFVSKTSFDEHESISATMSEDVKTPSNLEFGLEYSLPSSDDLREVRLCFCLARVGLYILLLVLVLETWLFANNDVDGNNVDDVVAVGVVGVVGVVVGVGGGASSRSP